MRVLLPVFLNYIPKIWCVFFFFCRTNITVAKLGQTINKYEIDNMIRWLHTENFFQNLVDPKPNFDSNYTFPTDLIPIGILIGVKSVGKVWLQSKFGLNYQNSEKISLCAYDPQRNILTSPFKSNFTWLR